MLEYFFFLFLVIFSAWGVVLNRNPIHSVFYLILVFCLSSLLLLFLGVEFIALLFIVVYVGAIAVLFLFVVMMLDLRQASTIQLVNWEENRYGKLYPIFFFFLFLFWEHNFLLSSSSSSLRYLNDFLSLDYVNFPSLLSKTNLQVLGESLYTWHISVFFLAAYILLLAMLGSILLTLKFHSSTRKQFNFAQINRTVYTTKKFFRLS